MCRHVLRRDEPYTGRCTGILRRNYTVPECFDGLLPSEENYTEPDGFAALRPSEENYTDPELFAALLRCMYSGWQFTRSDTRYHIPVGDAEFPI